MKKARGAQLGEGVTAEWPVAGELLASRNAHPLSPVGTMRTYNMYNNDDIQMLWFYHRNNVPVYTLGLAK